MQNDIVGYVLQAMRHDSTADQERAIKSLAKFIDSPEERTLFLLKGFAGTGKTTLVSALISSLSKIGRKSVLLAPTGRAAKVLASYSGHKAYTIHKMIYSVYNASDGTVKVTLRKNNSRNAVFIVDEASMISDSSSSSGQYGMRNLLDDLIEFVYSGSGAKLIFIGDEAQLPPVGSSISPALNIEMIKSRFFIRIASEQLTHVVRQEVSSGILFNATVLRKRLENEDFSFPLFMLAGKKQISCVSSSDLEELLSDAFYGERAEKSVVITRSNKRANLYNQEIRRRVLYQEDEINSGDLMMVVKNNYYWLPDSDVLGFIANGDTIEILKVYKIEEIYGFRFADVLVRLVDDHQESRLEVKIILDTLTSESPALTYEQNHALYSAVMEDCQDLSSRKSRLEEVKKNPYFNALQVKFSYALTCHKTQGGQWDIVFLDPGFLKMEMVDRAYIRWLYTAVTRATKHLYLLNFPSQFFIDKCDE